MHEYMLNICKGAFEKLIILRLFPNFLTRNLENFSNELICEFIIYEFTIRVLNKNIYN